MWALRRGFGAPPQCNLNEHRWPKRAARAAFCKRLRTTRRWAASTCNNASAPVAVPAADCLERHNLVDPRSEWNATADDNPIAIKRTVVGMRALSSNCTTAERSMKHSLRDASKCHCQAPRRAALATCTPRPSEETETTGLPQPAPLSAWDRRNPRGNGCPGKFSRSAKPAQGNPRELESLRRPPAEYKTHMQGLAEGQGASAPRGEKAESNSLLGKHIAQQDLPKKTSLKQWSRRYKLVASQGEIQIWNLFGQIQAERPSNGCAPKLPFRTPPPPHARNDRRRDERGATGGDNAAAGGAPGEP